MPRTQEVDAFFNVLQTQYGHAFQNQDTQELYDTSYALTRAYAAVGNMTLAGRWANECEKHTCNPDKIMALNIVLICGIIKQRYLNHG